VRCVTLRDATWRSLGLPLLGAAMLMVIQTSATGVASGTPTRAAALEPGTTIGTRPPTPPRPQPVPPAPAPAAAPAVPASGNPLAAIPLAQLAATRERPLFAPSRRPPPPPVVAAAAPVVAAPPPPPSKPARPDLSLVGTIVGQTGSIGLFLEAGSAKIVSLRPGEDHDGWILSALAPDAATLANHGVTAVLALHKPGTEQNAAVTSPYARGTRRVHH